MSDESTTLVAIQERSVDFHGDEILATHVESDGTRQVYIPLRPICDYLGLSWSGQRERVNRDPVLSEEVRVVRVTRTNLGGNPDLLCIPLEYINGWLFGVNATRVKPELKEKIIQYQRECYRILTQAFQTEEQVTEEQNASTSFATLQQIRDMGLAIAHMAEQQIEIEQRLNTRLDRAASVVSGINRRLSIVERRLSPEEA